MYKVTVSEFLVESGAGVVKSSSGGVLGITFVLLEERGILSPFTACLGQAHKMVSSLLMSSACNPVFLAAGWCHAPYSLSRGQPSTGAFQPPGRAEPVCLLSVTPGSLLWLLRPPCTPWACSPLSSAGSILRAPPASLLLPGSSVMSGETIPHGDWMPFRAVVFITMGLR